MLIVGFSEELVFRGAVLVGARTAMSERWVALFTSGLFGVFHLVSLLSGQGLGDTIVQCVGAAAFGLVMYVARRISGMLVLPMLLHAGDDFTSLAVTESGVAFDNGSVGLVVAVAVSAVALVKLTPSGARKADEAGADDAQSAPRRLPATPPDRTS